MKFINLKMNLYVINKAVKSSRR